MMEIWAQNWMFFIPLGIFSLTSLAIGFEKILLILRQKDLSDRQYSLALAYMEKGEWAQARSYFQDLTGPVAQLLKTCDDVEKEGLTEPSMKLASLAQQSLDLWKNRLPLLGHIANWATLTGLFGTVTGMMWSFGAIQAAGSADPAVVAGGISQALVTTFAGLGVALPSLLLHGWLTSLTHRKADQMEVVMSEYLSYHHHKTVVSGESWE